MGPLEEKTVEEGTTEVVRLKTESTDASSIIAKF